MIRKVGRSWQSGECITACELRYRLRRREDLFRFFVCVGYVTFMSAEGAWIGSSSPVSKLEGANKREQLSKILFCQVFGLFYNQKSFIFAQLLIPAR